MRCQRCKAYVNGFMTFANGGHRFQCNLCGQNNLTPDHYFCPLGPDGMRRDVYERPELCRGTVDFVATAEYMVRFARRLPPRVPTQPCHALPLEPRSRMCTKP